MIDVTFLDCLITILAALAGGALGCLFTIGYYHRAAQEHAAYEEELAQSHDVLAALALLRRAQADRRHGSCSREG